MNYWKNVGTITKRNKIVHEEKSGLPKHQDSIIAIYQLIQLLLEKGRDMDELKMIINKL